MRDDECIARLKDLEERIEALEGLVNLVLEELRDIRQMFEEGGQSGVARGRRRDEGHPLLKMIEDQKFVDVKDVRSKGALKRLVERGLVVLLRDEGANREVVASKRAISDLLNRLPIDVEKAESLDEREYELLEILNRLGYIIKKDNKYMPTQLAEEFKL
ncbi:hypothetical protein [Thermoproteus tenax]|uniref:Uncharacterized protein n=1 Tax=Thermoproteus tenax (strain ATCC 35583 / DSM 2078 / JCM 9277 / NBRC 100435 / Kra 1) TaxID=768679 RepID=G4RKM1_THETK|nr:hypothetical protein [Thermoproteus tenax]CCC82116.1 conserved hypothetical protein [Thermoproteus tenax Kra 1]